MVHTTVPRAPCILCAAAILASAAGCNTNPRNPGASEGPKLTLAEASRVEPAADKKLADPAIAAAVRRELGRDPGVAPPDVAVNVSNGIVELTGSVDNVLANERATRRAELVKGVRAVSNRIVVRAPVVADAVLVRDVTDALQFDAATHAYDIDVTAKNGAITLKGSAQSYWERLLAGRVAMGVRGVAELKNEIDVEHPTKRPDYDIARDVESRLRWDALVDHALVKVAVKDAKVTLTGAVGSAAEKRRAYWDAWLQGVYGVDTSGLEVKEGVGNEDVRRHKYVFQSDAEVKRAIQDVIQLDPRVSAAHVDVSFGGATATLNGTVESLKAKKAAEQIAEDTVGVLDVDNRLQVAKPTSLANAELQRRVRSALTWNPYTAANGITATADAGTVVLHGAVSSYFQKAEAESVASEIGGVRFIDNQIEVKKPTSAFLYDPYLYPYYPYLKTMDWHLPTNDKADVDITKDIESQLFWSPFVSSDRVHVFVQSGKATLTGEVASERERRVAAQDAYEGGATLVDNKIIVR